MKMNTSMITILMMMVMMMVMIMVMMIMMMMLMMMVMIMVMMMTRNHVRKWSESKYSANLIIITNQLKCKDKVKSHRRFVNWGSACKRSHIIWAIGIAK